MAKNASYVLPYFVRFLLFLHFLVFYALSFFGCFKNRNLVRFPDFCVLKFFLPSTFHFLSFRFPYSFEFPFSSTYFFLYHWTDLKGAFISWWQVWWRKYFFNAANVREFLYNVNGIHSRTLCSGKKTLSWGQGLWNSNPNLVAENIMKPWLGIVNKWRCFMLLLNAGLLHIPWCSLHVWLMVTGLFLNDTYRVISA